MNIEIIPCETKEDLALHLMSSMLTIAEESIREIKSNVSHGLITPILNIGSFMYFTGETINAFVSYKEAIKTLNTC